MIHFSIPINFKDVLILISSFLIISTSVIANQSLIGSWQNNEGMRMDIIDGFKPNVGPVIYWEKDGSTDGYSLKYKAQITIREHSYTCVVGEGEYNGTMNISATKERSGSVRIDSTASGSGLNDFIYQLFPLGDQPTGQGTGSFSAQYTPASQSESFVTSSDFYPYVTQVGLYDDFGQLLVVGKLGKPIKLSTQLDTTFVVRFDV